MAQALGHLPLKREPLNSNLCTTKKKKENFKPGCDKYIHVCMLASILYFRGLFVSLTAMGAFHNKNNFNTLFFEMNLDLLSVI
jgi:hypothetical protein